MVRVQISDWNLNQDKEENNRAAKKNQQMDKSQNPSIDTSSVHPELFSLDKESGKFNWKNSNEDLTVLNGIY